MAMSNSLPHIFLPNSPLRVSACCYGVAGFGTGVRGAEMERLYCAFREAGGNFFDTAHCYCFWIPEGLGASERALGECVRRFGGREEIVIATKGGHPAAGEGYLRPEDFLAPEVLARDVAESLERLGVDTIDLYWLHRDDPRRPVGEILEALNADIACGHLRALGASNWSIARLSEANTYAAAHGLHGFVASQPQWSLAHPNAPVPTEDPAMRYLMPDDQAWHAATGLPVIPYSSTACGYFASGGQKAAGAFDNAISRGRLARAEALADTHGATPNQIALAYLHHQPFPVIPILGTLNLAHLQDAMGMAAVHLTAEEVRWLAEGEHA